MKTILFLILTLALAGGASRGVAQPVITEPPRNQTNIAGTDATFTVAATGTPPLSYHWRSHLNSGSFTNIPFGTEATLVLTNVQPTPRRFGVVVTDGGGLSVTSTPLATLTVLLPATILGQPTNLTMFSASHATFSIVATGAAPTRLQWFFNQTLLPDKTNSSLTILNVQHTNQGAYTVVASNFLRSVTSEVATLTLLIPTNGQNVRLGDDPPALPTNMRAQAETHLARSFSDPNLVVATFQDGRFTDGAALGCGYAVSHDAGLTWSRGLIPGLTALTGGPFARATDPVAAIDHEGNIYLGTYAFVSSGRESMTISKSTNGGVSFSAPVLAVTNDSRNYFLDKNWLAVNTFPGTPTFGRLALSWTSLFITNGNVEVQSTRSNAVVVSDDGGLSWTLPHYVGPRRGQGTQPMFLPDGSLAMINWNFDGPRIEIAVSEDGGLTFDDPRLVADVQRYDDPVARAVGCFPSAVSDRMAGVIYVSWQGRLDATSNSRPCIFFTKSIDKGQTWTLPVVVNDTPDLRSVFTPAIAASPDGQHLTVSFYDKRHDPGQGFFVDLYLAESFDGGQTWESNVRLTDASSDMRRAPLTSTGYMLGDYQGIVPALDFDTPAIACWIDTRNSTPDPFVIRMDRRRGTTFETWRTLHFLTSELADPAISGDQANPDGDDSVNLLEYATGSDPKLSDSDHAPTGSFVTVEGQSYFALTFRRLILGYELNYVVEASNDLESWSPLTEPVGSPQLNPDGTQTVTIRDSAPASATSHRYLRLRVSRQ